MEFDQIQNFSTVQRIELIRGLSRLKFDFQAETQSCNPSKRMNEDAILNVPMGEGRQLFGVLDGASSQKQIEGLAKYGITGAFYASHITSLGFSQSDQYKELCAQTTLTAGDVVRSINLWLHDKYQNIVGVNYGDVLSVPGMAATLALVDAANKEVSIAHVADSVGCAVYTDGKIEILTNNQNEKFDVETLQLCQQLASEYDCTLAQLREISEAKRRKHEHVMNSFRRKINSVHGCGVLNGMSELETHNLIHETSVRVTDDLAAILLFSDGALLPYLYKQLTIENALFLLVTDAVTENKVGYNFIATGIQQLLDDCDFEKIPREKAQDDATIIKLSFIDN